MEGMQNLYEMVYEMATTIKQTALLEKTTALIQFIETQEFTNVAVTGARNSGKTTFINEIVASKVWEPGALDETEKPLRISFEPLQEDERYNCLMVANPPWHDLKAVIYELREEQLFDGDAPAEDMSSLDMVFYITSASSPLGKEEVDALKALAPFKRQVVVNGMHLVDEANRERVLNYIENINSALGLPPVIVFESGKNLGKLVRNLVPSFRELQTLREQKCRLIFKNMLETFKTVTRNEIANLESTARKSNTISLKNDGLRSGCYTLRMDVEDYKKAAIENVTGRLSSRRENLINEILQEAKQLAAEDKIQTAAEEKYNALSKAAIEALQKNFFEDLKNVDSSARLLGIPQWRADTAAQLMNFSPIKILEQIAPEKLTVNSAEATRSNATLLVGTGIIAGGLALAPTLMPTLAPLPPMVSVAGTVVTLGYGLVSYMKDKSRKNRAELNALDDAIRKAVENIKDFVRKVATISYGKISEQILRGEENLQALPPAKNESRLAQLNDILNTFNRMEEKLEG